MSLNSSHFSSFVLSAYLDLGPLRYFFFCVVLLLYCITICSNVLLITVICLNRSLHEPMYIFLCALFVNELYGSTMLCPSLLVHIVKDAPHLVPASLCFLQISSLHLYGFSEYLLLATISYDRFVAICRPLQYRAYMTKTKIAVLLFAPFCYNVLMNIIMISQTMSLQLCRNVIPKVYCDNYPMVKLACSDTGALNIRGLFFLTVNVLSPLLVIVLTYGRILKMCLLGSKQTRHKALSTCSPHLGSLLNFTVGSCFEMVQSRFDLSQVPFVIRIFLSLYFLVCQPLWNPFIYGLVLSKIRVICRHLLLKLAKHFSFKKKSIKQDRN